MEEALWFYSVLITFLAIYLACENIWIGHRHQQIEELLESTLDPNEGVYCE